MLNKFIAFLDGQVDKALYALGGQTQVIKSGIVYSNDKMTKSLGSLEKWLADIGQKSNFATINKLYLSRVKKWGDKVFHIFDCSGLGMYFIYNLHHIALGDMTANGMKAKCKKIDKADMKKGDWVFRTYVAGSKKGRAYHVGYVVDDALNIVEDKGKAYGVVKNPYNSSYWNYIGRPEYFAEEIEAEPVSVKPIFHRVLKRTKPTMTGDDVKALQMLLNEVNGADLVVDSHFGKLTEKAVKNFQKIKGLKVDGKAGKNTITALGGVYV